MKNSGRFLGIVTVLFALVACNGGGGGGTGTAWMWYDAWGNGCSMGDPSPGCDYAYGGAKISIMQDPYYYVMGPANFYDYWMSPDGIVYSGGMALNSTQDEHGRDTITNGAVAQRKALADNARMLQARYGLDADVAMHATQAMNEWSALSRSRKRTDADLAAFAQRVSGLNVEETSAAISAAARGDDAGVNQAIEKAARNWSIHPDTMKQILGDWLRQQQN